MISIDRAPLSGARGPTGSEDILRRSRKSIILDLKQKRDTEVALQLVSSADILIEGFRPGVMERLGLGPDVCQVANPRLVYGRMTGWGQFGPLAQAAGHDINYIALSGALNAIGLPDSPVVPLNLLGDFGGGGMLLAFGVMCAVIESRSSGKGQVIDAAMTDGSALLMSMVYSFKAAGQWSNQRADNLLDGGAPFYGTYQCADGKWISIGSLEPQFYAELLRRCGLHADQPPPQRDRAGWERLREKLRETFLKEPRAHWCGLMEGTDVCFAPVLDLDEAPLHPHNRARGTFCEIDGRIQPAPAPRFSRSVPATPRPPVDAGAHTQEILQGLSR